jgi:peptide/nickel transport system permease protein
MSLLNYLARRAGLTIFVLFGVSLITFVITHIVPADPVVAYLGGHAPPAHASRRCCRRQSSQRETS